MMRELKTQILLNNNFNGMRLFMHAQDDSGNWGDFSQSQSVANYRKFLITVN